MTAGNGEIRRPFCPCVQLSPTKNTTVCRRSSFLVLSRAPLSLKTLAKGTKAAARRGGGDQAHVRRGSHGVGIKRLTHWIQGRVQQGPWLRVTARSKESPWWSRRCARRGFQTGKLLSSSSLVVLHCHALSLRDCRCLVCCRRYALIDGCSYVGWTPKRATD